jgi:hypothetical protein
VETQVAALNGGPGGGGGFFFGFFLVFFFFFLHGMAMEFLFGISGQFFFPPFLSSGFLEDMAFLEGTRSGGLCFCFVLIQTLIEA